LGPEAGSFQEDGIAMLWEQRTVELRPLRRGCHLITAEVLNAMPEIAEVSMGLLHVFVQHTSASLTLNENADPDVRVDLESSLNVLAPEDFPYEHTIEGRDDMPAHVKASLMGSSVTIPISRGRPALGTWQGIYFCEHRNHGGPRSVVITLQGQTRQDA
jgi:secondary thiamine-phosphate synthase enzyme